MTPKRFLTIAALALITATVPIEGGAANPSGLRLSTASCMEADCGSVAKVDCICPDIQMRNRLPRCIDPAP